jgi:hypothetical protein
MDSLTVLLKNVINKSFKNITKEIIETIHETYDISKEVLYEIWNETNNDFQVKRKRHIEYPLEEIYIEYNLENQELLDVEFLDNEII